MEAALARRWDEYKKTIQINEMICMYVSTTQKHILELETTLVSWFWNKDPALAHKLNKNRVGGGGGPHAAGPNFYLYLAIAMPGSASSA